MSDILKKRIFLMDVLIQFVVALMFGMAGLMKATQPKEKLASNMGWVNDFSQLQVRGIGILEILGAIGVILPKLTNILPFLTPLAALGLMLTMIGAALVHLRRKEYPLIGVNLFLFILAGIVLLNNWYLLTA